MLTWEVSFLCSDFLNYKMSLMMFPSKKISKNLISCLKVYIATQNNFFYSETDACYVTQVNSNLCSLGLNFLGVSSTSVCHYADETIFKK